MHGTGVKTYWISLGKFRFGNGVGGVEIIGERKRKEVVMQQYPEKTVIINFMDEES